MIDYYLNNESLKTEDKIQECYSYYQSKEYTFDELYSEYDKINLIKPRLEFSEDNSFFKKNTLKPIKTIFMKECLLEALKRYIETKSYVDIKDPQSELNDDITNYKDDFNYYPDIIETNIPDKLFAKEELRRHIIPSEVGTIEDKCNSQFFELAPHQIFLKNLLSPNTQYRGILIFHGVGVGKSCSGISIAENFKDVYAEKENRIIILASQNIQIGWRKTIFDPRKGDDQCTGETYFFDDENDDQKVITDKKAKKTIKKYYELYGYAAFANSVKKLIHSKTNHIADEKEKLNIEIQTIRETYSNRILIIDEVHNIRSGESEKKSRNTILYIEKVLRYSDNLRLILLTANPMYNISSEIVWILNMLLLNDRRMTIPENQLFDSSGNLINEDLLREKSKGYISYLRGENPVSFPVRLYPNHNQENLIRSPGIPKDFFGNDISDEKRLSFLELYASKLEGRQLEIYSQLTDKIIKEASKKRSLDYKLQIQDETLLLQLSNIVYPGNSYDRRDDDDTELYGETGLLNCFTRNTKQNSVEYEYKKEILDEYGEFFHKDLIGLYSAKIKSILEIIQQSDGIIFIYTNWIKSGVVPLVLALEQNGYLKYDGKKILKTKEKRELISCEGKLFSEYEDKKDFNPARYMVISGSENLTHNLEDELRIVTSDENKDGHKIKIIIGSSVASEGLDFKNIRSIHILEPWHNINKLEQVIGRGIRNCSHKLLDQKSRNVTVYLHTSSIEDKETIDTYLYRYSEFKAKQIGKVELILKQEALDKYFFKEANYLSKKDVEKFKVEPAYRYNNGLTRTFMYQPNDKKYSRVCSFTNICNYMKDDKPIEMKINDDTFKIQYSQGLIDVYKKRIHNLFIESVSYTLDELIDGLSEYKEVYEDILFHAIREMEFEKYTLHNRFGDKGYLTITDGLYNFQPYFNSDKLLAPYYRLNKGFSQKVNYSIESKKKRESDITTEKQSFHEELIVNVYNKIINYEFQDYESKILQSLNIEKQHPIRYAYIVDRLSYHEKLILGYSVLLFIQNDEIYNEVSFMKSLIEIIQSLFIYYNVETNTFIYRDIYEDKYKDELVGFFLYHNINKRPIFYQYENREIEIYNKVDEIDIVQMIRKNKNHKSLSLSGSWGFTTYSDRNKYKDNGILLKVIKKSDKLKKRYVYPPGPGVNISSQSTGAWIGESTLKFIKEDLSDYLEIMSETDRTQFLSNNIKKEYVFFIEICFRMKKVLMPSDLIFMKYY